MHRFSPARLLLPITLLTTAACGDDSDGAGGSGGSASDASSATGTTTSTVSTSADSSTSSGGDASGGGTGSGGDGGGAPLEIVEGPGFRSGSRLRPVYLDGGDGARQLLHWYDTELGLACRFSEDTAAGDRYSCVPIAHAEAAIVFTDEACTEPVMRITDGECGDRFAATSTDLEVVGADTADLQARGTRTVYERGDPLEPALVVYERTFQGCGPVELEPGQRIHAALAPSVPLASASRELESLGDGLARAVARGADGSMQLMGPFHEDSGSPCQRLLNRPTADGGSACAPAVVAEFASPTTYLGAIHYADDTCSTPAASIFTGDLVPVLGDYVIGPSEVEGELIAYERGEELEVAYSNHTGECAPHVNGMHHYTVGTLLDRTFPQVFYFDVPGARLATRTDGSMSGEVAATARGFSDTAFADAWCEPLVFWEEEEGDSQAPLRCVSGAKLGVDGLPFPTESDFFFADDACTDPLVEFEGGVAYRPRALDQETCSDLPERQGVRDAVLFAAHEGDVYELWGELCRPYSGNQSFSRRVRELGPEDFAIVTLVDPSTEAP